MPTPIAEWPRKQNLHDFNGAITNYSTAIKLDPDNAVAYGQRASLRAFARDWDGAMTDFDEAVKPRS